MRFEYIYINKNNPGGLKWKDFKYRTPSKQIWSILFVVVVLININFRPLGFEWRSLPAIFVGFFVVPQILRTMAWGEHTRGWTWVKELRR